MEKVYCMSCGKELERSPNGFAIYDAWLVTDGNPYVPIQALGMYGNVLGYKCNECHDREFNRDFKDRDRR